MYKTYKTLIIVGKGLMLSIVRLNGLLVATTAHIDDVPI